MNNLSEVDRIRSILTSPGGVQFRSVANVLAFETGVGPCECDSIFEALARDCGLVLPLAATPTHEGSEHVH
ncbi:hypothetical protein DEM27_15440 [Metarhizobium album]|uniref:Uncharacterized protein n=1 Tax=Metarhizobium album TaxID=2182425 RepID=A0A2U2DQ63_9HYPH|nr:hypothetical protein DEM27_15440 [Rhizobium album]